MDENELKKLERANPIIQVAIELGIKIQGNLGRCFRQLRHPVDDQSMTLFFDAARNTFFCRTCQDIGGSVIDLVRQYRGLSDEEAIAWLAHRMEFDKQTRDRYHGRGREKI